MYDGPSTLASQKHRGVQMHELNMVEACAQILHRVVCTMPDNVAVSPPISLTRTGRRTRNVTANSVSARSSSIRRLYRPIYVRACGRFLDEGSRRGARTKKGARTESRDLAPFFFRVGDRDLGYFVRSVLARRLSTAFPVIHVPNAVPLPPRCPRGKQQE